MKVVDDDGNEVAQGEVGEIVIKGHNVMKGYWDRPTPPRSRSRTAGSTRGDMAKVDEDGYFFIVDRKKELIIRGGYNVYPREVEEVLYEHPAVAEAAVVGVPGRRARRGGRRRGGPQGGRAAVGADELRDHVKSEVAAYKYPRRIWFVDELPRADRQDPQARDRGAGGSGSRLRLVL